MVKIKQSKILKIGDKVRITNMGRIYPGYVSMVEAMIEHYNLNNKQHEDVYLKWVKTREENVCMAGDEGYIIATSKHEDDEDGYVALVSLNETYVLINFEGIEIVEQTKEDSRMWTRSDGKKILIKDMTTQHINNAIRKIKRENPNDYMGIEAYQWLEEEIQMRNNGEVNKFNNGKLNKEYSRLLKELRLINREDLIGETKYQLKKAELDGFVLACKVLDVK